MKHRKEIRNYHAPNWNEPVIMEMGSDGRRGIIYRKTNQKIFDELGDAEKLLPKGMFREENPGLPELSEHQVQRRMAQYHPEEGSARGRRRAQGRRGQVRSLFQPRTRRRRLSRSSSVLSKMVRRPSQPAVTTTRIPNRTGTVRNRSNRGREGKRRPSRKRRSASATRRSARGRAAMRQLDMRACMAREARGCPDRKEYLGTHVRLALVKSRSSVVEMVFRF